MTLIYIFYIEGGGWLFGVDLWEAVCIFWVTDLSDFKGGAFARVVRIPVETSIITVSK